MGYSIEVTTGPATEPVTLAEAKAHCRIDGTDEDAELTTLISVARKQVESWSNRALIDQTVAVKLSRFPRWGSDIILPNPPLASVTSVSYVDTDGATQTDSSPVVTYNVDTASEPGRIALLHGSTWPTTRDQHLPVTIIYQAGWANAGDVPVTIKQAMLLAIGQLYCSRQVTGTTTTELAFGFSALLDAESFGPAFVSYDPAGALS